MDSEDEGTYVIQNERKVVPKRIFRNGDYFMIRLKPPDYLDTASAIIVEKGDKVPVWVEKIQGDDYRATPQS